MEKLTEKQQEVIDILSKYPTAIIMWDGYLTGGYGKLDLRVVNSLKKKGLIVNNKLKK